MTGDVVKAIAAVAVVYSKKMAMDLEAFSKHAGRQHINADDCKLLARNLPVQTFATCFWCGKLYP